MTSNFSTTEAQRTRRSVEMKKDFLRVLCVSVVNESRLIKRIENFRNFSSASLSKEINVTEVRRKSSENLQQGGVV